MISALTGSTTEPVIRNRITSVVTVQDGERDRQSLGERRLQVDERAVCPPVSAARAPGRPGRRGPGPSPAHQRRALGRHVDPPQPADRSATGATAATPSSSAKSARVVSTAGAFAAGTATTRRRWARAGSRVEASSTIRPLASLGSTLASTPVNSTRRNGMPIKISSADVPIATGVRVASPLARAGTRTRPLGPGSRQRLSPSAFTRGPSTASKAGSTVSETTPPSAPRPRRRSPSSTGTAAGRR